MTLTTSPISANSAIIASVAVSQLWNKAHKPQSIAAKVAIAGKDFCDCRNAVLFFIASLSFHAERPAAGARV